MKKILLLGLSMLLLSSCVRQPLEVPKENVDLISTLVAATLTAEPQSKEKPDLTAVASVSSVTPDPAVDQAEATDSAETATISPSVTPTSTPTATFTATHTSTAQSTPTLAPEDPILSLGVPSAKDTFDQGSIIYQYDETQSSFQVEDDQFVLVAKKSNGYETWSLSWEELKNFYVEISGTFGENCGGKDRYGMIFRAPDSSEGYLVSISCDGSYRLSSYESEADEYTIIKNWTTSEWINSGAGGENRLGVWVKGSEITVYLNGHKEFKVSDDTFSKGRFGVLVAASNTPGFTAYLSQVVYWKLP